MSNIEVGEYFRTGKGKIYKEKNGKGYIRKTKYKTIEIEVEELGWK